MEVTPSDSHLHPYWYNLLSTPEHAPWESTPPRHDMEEITSNGQWLIMSTLCHVCKVNYKVYVYVFVLFCKDCKLVQCSSIPLLLCSFVLFNKCNSISSLYPGPGVLGEKEPNGHTFPPQISA